MTDDPDADPADRKSPNELDTLGQGTPLGRAGQPVELALPCMPLAAAEDSYMSGMVIAVTDISIG
ncbi:hypothetical protein [Sphingomonas bacterium]|uniref:hypothetical protein n=1 Tax=Sphingomonas bacterium TaxID=1895847 RepID=UPI0015761D02|nr:hypothetical protein [Sphingomonas bacterium]